MADAAYREQIEKPSFIGESKKTVVEAFNASPIIINIIPKYGSKGALMFKPTFL